MDFSFYYWCWSRLNSFPRSDVILAVEQFCPGKMWFGFKQLFHFSCLWSPPSSRLQADFSATLWNHPLQYTWTDSGFNRSSDRDGYTKHSCFLLPKQNTSTHLSATIWVWLWGPQGSICMEWRISDCKYRRNSGCSFSEFSWLHYVMFILEKDVFSVAEKEQHFLLSRFPSEDSIINCTSRWITTSQNSWDFALEFYICLDKDYTVPVWTSTWMLWIIL